MADAITIKALQDASLDAKSLEDVVNGDDAKQVTTRLGETYPSVKKAIKTMFENGGLPATPFKTKALMTASSLANGDYAMVTDDTVNSGLYLKTAGSWVKSEYDPLNNAKSYTDAILRAYVHQNDPTLNIIGYASPEAPTPPSPSELDAWIVTKSGTVFGVSANIGNIVYYDGSNFVRTYLNRTYYRPSIYPTPLHGYILDVEDPYVYFKSGGGIVVRGDYSDTSFTWAGIKSTFSELIGTSPMGESECLVIENGYAFVFNVRDRKLEVIWYLDVLPYHIELIRYVNQETTGVFPDKETRQTAQELRGNLRMRWQLGGVSPTNNGLPLALSTRLRTTMFEPKGDIQVVFNELTDYKYIVVYYDENGDFVKITDWLTINKLTIPYVSGQRLRFLLAKNNNEVLTILDRDWLDVIEIKDWSAIISSSGENKNPRYISPLFSKPNSIREPKLYHHRAHQSLAPENSLPAMIASGESGVWGIETDVLVTADGVLVCHHDATIDRMTDGTGNLADKTYAQLMEATIDTGANVGNFTTDELKIPTFRKHLEICRFYGMVPFIEIKTNGIIEPIVEMLKEFGMEEFSIISSFNLNHLVQTRNLSDRIFVHHIMPSSSDYGTLVSLGNSGLSLNYPDPNTVPEGLIDEIHKMGLKVCLRAADTNAHAIKMVEIGVDYMPTNTLVSLST